MQKKREKEHEKKESMSRGVGGWEQRKGEGRGGRDRRGRRRRLPTKQRAQCGDSIQGPWDYDLS